MTWRTHEEGFTVDFPNGWTASVVWGVGAYGSNHMKKIKVGKKLEAKLVEVGAWRTGNRNIWIDEEMVKPYLTHQEVLDYMQSVSNLEDSDEIGYNTVSYRTWENWKCEEIR